VYNVDNDYTPAVLVSDMTYCVSKIDTIKRDIFNFVADISALLFIAYVNAIYCWQAFSARIMLIDVVDHGIEICVPNKSVKIKH